jgi:hypothetical protein
MKRTWETPELKELTLDKTMSGVDFESGEDSQEGDCIPHEGRDMVTDQQIEILPIPERTIYCLSS